MIHLRWAGVLEVQNVGGSVGFLFSGFGLVSAAGGISASIAATLILLL